MRSRIAHATIVGVALTLISAVYGREFYWPDYYHVEYGLPFAWLIRTLSTIAGPTDKFAFQPLELVLDLVFWFVAAFLVLFLIDRFRRSSH